MPSYTNKNAVRCVALLDSQTIYAKNNTVVPSVTNVLPDCCRQVNGSLLLGAKVCQAQALQPIQECLFQSEGLSGVRQSATCSYMNGTIPESLAGTCVLTDLLWRERARPLLPDRQRPDA